MSTILVSVHFLLLTLVDSCKWWSIIFVRPNCSQCATYMHYNLLNLVYAYFSLFKILQGRGTPNFVGNRFQYYRFGHYFVFLLNFRPAIEIIEVLVFGCLQILNFIYIFLIILLHSWCYFPRDWTSTCP